MFRFQIVYQSDYDRCLFSNSTDKLDLAKTVSQ
jgi:hypothetical protein